MVEQCLRGLVRDVPIDWSRGTVVYRGPLLRFSGEVTTSLGNTLNNIVCICVARKIAELDLSQDRRSVGDVTIEEWRQTLASVPLVCEGDDSVQAIPGCLGANADLWVSKVLDALARFGLIVKPERYDHVSEAGFCGCMWNPHNGHLYSRDPLFTLSKFCWTSGRYNHTAMLALKAQSMATQFPH